VEGRKCLDGVDGKRAVWPPGGEKQSLKEIIASRRSLKKRKEKLASDTPDAREKKARC